MANSIAAGHRGKLSEDNKITLNISPEILDNVDTMNDPNTRVVLNNALTDTQVFVDSAEDHGFVHKIVDEIKEFTNEYDDADYRIKAQFDKLDNAILKLSSIRANEKIRYPDGKIDFSFITDP